MTRYLIFKLISCFFCKYTFILNLILKCFGVEDSFESQILSHSCLIFNFSCSLLRGLRCCILHVIMHHTQMHVIMHHTLLGDVDVRNTNQIQMQNIVLFCYIPIVKILRIIILRIPWASLFSPFIMSSSNSYLHKQDVVNISVKLRNKRINRDIPQTPFRIKYFLLILN